VGTVIGEDERIYWVALSAVGGIGPVRFQRLLELCGGPRQAWSASDLQLAQAGLERRTIAALRNWRKVTSPEAFAERLGKLEIRAVTLRDDEYPPSLRQVADPPPVLFVRGSFVPRDQPAVALVGTRRASPYGISVADRLARDLAAAGITIVSGLAKGVDTAAHQAALDANGRTVAVLGNGLDQIYPPENLRLARRIVDNAAGVLVSEFAPGIPPDAVNFPRRNRIISGISMATLIVEAGEKSGALITADFALEQGREVLAVPGPIFNPMSAGTNDLLKQGAAPVTCVDDILRLLNTVYPDQTNQHLARELPPLAPHEAAVYEALATEPRHIDEITRAARVAAHQTSAALMTLELGGLARQVGPMLYTRS
jgi:DNA processing protein